VLEPYKVLYVGVFCDDRVLAHREILRGDRMHGWARGSQIYAHMDAEYDIIIDTTAMSPAQCAERIRLAIEGGLEPAAAERMRAKFCANKDKIS
ncbi:MAG: chloramphenicol phosphotransferase CPT family protein, partial [Cyanobacteria bacterium]|nr:chloramphenicol phosphotransferase CPT family protein [Cyanobacteriota bacterium]